MATEPNFTKGNGLVPVIVQDCQTREVLMLAYMNAESWKRTLETGTATYWSRSRNCFWVKGEQSGNTQLVREVMIDCDEDTILLVVEQQGGAACHTGYRSCFFRRIEQDGSISLACERVFDPKEVYR